MKNGMIALVLVALVSLGIMGLIGSHASMTGDFKKPRPGFGKKPTMPKKPPVRVVDRGPDTVVVEQDDEPEYVYAYEGYSTEERYDLCVVANEVERVLIAQNVQPSAELKALQARLAC